ncbi:MAG: hypothetical protein LAP39_08115 [Acidobacteriia bacterium]|nr:hypothetical protein [Terriglobia bacterium]
MIFRTKEIRTMNDCDGSGTRPVVQRGSLHSATRRVLTLAAVVSGFIGVASAGTFGTVVPIRGHVSDIALDQARGLVYAANFTASRIELISTADLSLQTPLFVANQPSSLALSPDGRYLVVGHYANPAAPTPALTIIDRNANTVQTSPLDGSSVLAVAFGNSPQALVVTNNGVLLVDPATGTSQVLQLNPFDTKGLPVPWATFPPQIVLASAGVSGDGQMIYVLWDSNSSSQTSAVVQYSVATGALTLIGITSTPSLGPTTVSVDTTGANFLTGWILFNTQFVSLAEFPYPTGKFNVGSHAIDSPRGLVYADVPTGVAGETPVLHIMDADNLTVRERLQLRENLAGKSLLSSDDQVMYSISDSGVMMLPVGSLSKAHRVMGGVEDIVFTGSGCDNRAMTNGLSIVDPGGNATDFTLTTVPADVPGVTISSTKGTTPARVQIHVDPTAFQSQKGTTVVQVQIASKSAVNLPPPVRLLINTRDPDQKGKLLDIPGKIVDVLADPARDRFYVIRQDKNLVQAFDGTSLKRIASMRTGNTPVQMAMTRDSRYLIVGNDNSQIASVFDLDTLQPSQFIVLPPGYYPRTIAVSNAAILATCRVSGPLQQVVRIDFANRVATAPTALGIYKNSIDNNAVLMTSPSGSVVAMAMPDGTVALYEAASDTFVASRKDLSALGGAYAALSDSEFVVDTNVLDGELVPVGQLDATVGSSSGLAPINGSGLRSTTPSGAINGTIQRFRMDTLAPMRPVRTTESPALTLSLQTPPVGQIGETILPFTRTLAPLANQQSIVQTSTSGVMVLPWNFDALAGVPSISAVTNAADQTSGVAPGGVISITGKNLSASNESTSKAPVATALGDVCLYVNSEALPLFMVSPTQINAQLPFDVAASANMVLTTSGGMTAPLSLTPQATAPAIFRTSGAPMIIRKVDGKTISDSAPIHLNAKLTIYLTGMGATNPAVDTGDAGPSNPLAAVTATPTITIGGASIFVLSAGMAPNQVGVYQIDAQVPFHHIPTGHNIPFTITQGDSSTTVRVRVVE